MRAPRVQGPLVSPKGTALALLGDGKYVVGLLERRPRLLVRVKVEG